ncbi:E3 ubiquitin- ligase DZIP3 [Paramuricea clavata]|uniref:E3 ubiquitin- ligase DZIP3 n=1 Tax=Paramuricea clavata TaxID=317549 RepID=A0A6S7J9G0_PARCT|nr:E3 ubiquitin- ligase DZIP3 [Paramuricea clavata]
MLTGMNSSKEHINWITVGEVINLIKKPVALYTTHIVKRWHVTLCKDCLPFGQCPNPGNCQMKKKPVDLCRSCNGWYKELAKSHLNKDKRKIEWRKNCDTSKLPVDPWEVAKFFMPVLGDNKGTVIEAESTDLAHLLNVLVWMKDVAFAPDRRVDRDLVNDLRSGVRNPWAHAPNQELADADFNNAFDIANKFVADLDNVFSCNEVKKCIGDIKLVQTNKISNVVEAELKALNLLRGVLGADVSQLKGEIKNLKEDQSFDRQVIKEQERMLENLVNCTKECSTRMDRFDELFCREISEIRADIKSLQGTNDRFQQKSCLPDKPPKIFGRDAEVKKIVCSLVDEGCGIVSIVGGPGFGKSTIAVEVSHHLSDSHDIEVIFSFLSNVSTVPEVIQRLCRDVGVNPGDDPESSLIFWLKSIEKKVVLVMDNIEQLLESNVISLFTELMATLRKNSRRQLQILTTTRTEFSIPDRTTENVHVRELDKNASVELLRTFCRNKEVKDEILSDLAKLCGYVPLALCITGSRIPRLNDPAEMIKWLKEKPMKALQSTDKSQCVRKAIEFSFQMLSSEDKKALVRLSVFNGNFQRMSAEEVIDRDDFETQDLLDQLVARSLIQSSSDNRFVIHSLIRRYLADHEQLQDEKAVAQGLMVKHFLKMCHLWTIDSYTKDRFIDAREKLKTDSHNVEETLKVCCQDPNVVELLVNSDIYKSSSTFFYRFCRYLLPQIILRNFQESCINLAKTRKQLTIAITFQCLVAGQEGRKSAWKSTEYLDMMEAIKDALDQNKAVLKEDRSVYSYCYYFYARFHSSQANVTPCPDLEEDDLSPLPENNDRSPMKNAEETLILIQRARLNKKRAVKVFRSDKKKYEDYMNCAKSFYDQALSTAKEFLGDHEITCICYKLLGDLYLHWRKNDEAMEYYSDAIKLRKKLQLDSNEAFVYLLKNYGLCLRFLRRFEASVENLNEACDIADKLAEKHTPCRANVLYQLANTYRAWKPDCQESAKYAKEAKEMQVLLDPRTVKSLEDIIKTAEEYMKEKNLIRSFQNIVNVVRTDRQLQQNSSIPDKPLTFVGRCAEVNKIIYSLVENGCGIVSIVGGPGFGKSSIAVEVSHHLSNMHDIVVIFSFLSNVSTVPEVLLRLCLDVGVNPGEDPESALLFWLNNTEKKVLLVMDNIEHMLEEEVRSEFTELVVTLRKNSQQQLQILTTTRTEFSIPEQTTENVQLGELDEKSCVELLRKYCPNTEVKDSYLCDLADLCGFIPLALCIAGPRIADLDDPFELIHWLKEKPVKTLLTSDKSQCVRKAIEFSFQQLNDDDRKALARLSLFNGNFQRKSAEEVIERDELVTQDFLEQLVARSLIMQRSSDKRFLIHSLIRRFLADHHQFQDEKIIAQGLMVKHFLKMCHSLTMDSFSKNGFTDARESLKMDSHNVEETLKVCCQDQATNLNPNIFELLINSDIYKSSSRLFYRFCRDLLSQTILRNFQEYCINLAKIRKQLTIAITFQCLVADQEGRKSAWKSTEYIDMMEAIKDALDQNKAVLKEDRSLYSYCYYFYAQYYSKQAHITPCPDLEEDDLSPLPENNDRSPMENAEETLILTQRAHLNKKRAMKVFRSDKEKYEDYMNCAKSFSSQALSASQELFGDHELTYISYKALGDLYSLWRRNKEALLNYSGAIKLSKKLKLDSNEPFVYLLKSYGLCLSFLRYFDESVAILNEARDIADKLAQKHSPCRANVYCALAIAYRAWKPDCKEAAKYANAAVRMGESLHSVKTMKDIIKTAEEHME